MALGAIAARKEAGKLEGVKVGGFFGAPDAVAAIIAGEMQYTVLQPVAVFSAEAETQADSFIKTGAATEKQLFDCLLITKDNVANDIVRSPCRSERTLGALSAAPPAPAKLLISLTISLYHGGGAHMCQI